MASQIQINNIAHGGKQVFMYCCSQCKKYQTIPRRDLNTEEKASEAAALVYDCGWRCDKDGRLFCPLHAGHNHD